MFQVFVSTYPFGKEDPTPKKMLDQVDSISVTYNPHPRKLTREEIAELARDAQVVIAGTEDLSLLIENSAHLRLISRVGIGLDSVNLSLCKKKGIRVCYTPDAVTMAVAELTIGLMVSLTRRVGQADRGIREKKWNRYYGKRIGESVIGLIGFGRVGKNVARLLAPFKPQILVHDIKNINPEIEFLRKQGLNIELNHKEEIYKKADIISLHLPAYSLTRDMISKESLKLFKKDSFLINTARGELVNESDLYLALQSGEIGGAALDVFKKEPYSDSLSELENVILTQHMGSCSFDCRLAMETEATEDAIRFLQGESLLREVPESEYLYQ